MNPSSTLRVASIATGLGRGVLGASAPGVQLGLQGCTIGCPGCTSVHTHSTAAGRLMPLAELMRLMQHLHQRGQLARLTVTGGEPSEQAPALQSFLSGFCQSFPATEVVLYSGRTWAALQRHFPGLVELCDVVVAGPFKAHLPPTPMAGSDNQTVHLLTPRAERLYRDLPQWPLHRVQLSVSRAEDGMQRMLMVGIPQRAVATVLEQRHPPVQAPSDPQPLTRQTP